MGGFPGQFQGQYPGQSMGGFPGQFPGQLFGQPPSQPSSQSSNRFPGMVITQSSGQMPGVTIIQPSGTGQSPGVFISPYPGQVLGQNRDGQPGGGWPAPPGPKPRQRFRTGPERVRVTDLKEDETDCPICYRDYYTSDSQNESEDATSRVSAPQIETSPGLNHAPPTAKNLRRKELARDDAIPSAKETPPVDSIDDDLSHGEQSPDGLFGRRHALYPLGGTTHRLPHDNARAHEATANTRDSRPEPLTRSLSPDRCYSQRHHHVRDIPDDNPRTPDADLSDVAQTTRIPRFRMRDGVDGHWPSALLQCCGYLSSNSPPFFQDSVCTNPLVAAQLSGCVGPFSTLANNYLDLIFTAAFGVVGIDVALILCIAMLVKDRKEKERYRHIDEKSGTAGF
ncbi:hypothetical protein V500_07436 [Pseudogymnoascus sp. VKM F-4518 (FW-2643)]|nr:hypothetical protein V500_07436 [Pseudogymnoascus sp. VKM F-4518 (FW-2643)]